MQQWTFLSNHGRALLCIARDPEIRLRDIATELGLTERSSYAIVSDLAEGGYITKHRDGRRTDMKSRPIYRSPRRNPGTWPSVRYSMS